MGVSLLSIDYQKNKYEYYVIIIIIISNDWV